MTKNKIYMRKQLANSGANLVNARSVRMFTDTQRMCINLNGWLLIKEDSP